MTEEDMCAAMARVCECDERLILALAAASRQFDRHRRKSHHLHDAQLGD